jgi:hypothetical protein
MSLKRDDTDFVYDFYQLRFSHATPVYEALAVAIPESTYLGIVYLVTCVEWANLRVVPELFVPNHSISLFRTSISATNFS